MRILTVPEDTTILRSKSQPVKKIDAELMTFLRDLGKTLKDQKDPAGVGLSAIQAGRPIRAFATFLPEEENNEQKIMSNGEKTKSKKQKAKIVFYINPEIVDHSKEMTLGENLVDQNDSSDLQPSTFGLRPFLEGCLSIPDIYGPVLRWPWIKAKAFVLTEQALLPNSVFSIQYSVFTLEALASRVFQHELDHLNGILFTDHVLAQGNKLYREEGRELAAMEM